MTRAESIVASLLGEGIDPRLAQVCTERLAAMGLAEKGSMLKHCDNLQELHSYLREYVFHSDAPTIDFVRQCRLALQSQPVAA
jgi:hypothetical protein